MRKITILLEKPEKPANIGVVMRNIYAFDSGRMYLQKDVEVLKKIGTACGTGTKVSIERFSEIEEFLKNTIQRKIGFIVAEHDKKNIPINLTEFKFEDNDLLVFGGEGPGLTDETKALCDKLVTIPMLGHMGCLNLAVSTGIVLYEVLRQKVEKGSITLKSLKEKKSVIEKAEWWAKN